MNIMKNTDLTQQAPYTAPSVRVVNVNLRQTILNGSQGETGGDDIVL